MANYFLVTTYGRSASHWLVKTLNMHKDIVCSHGVFGGKVKPITDVGMHVSDDYDLDAIHSEVARNWSKITLDDLFDELEKVQSVNCYGNVHGFSWSTLIDKITKENVTRKIRAVNIVRHPFNRILSSINEWNKEERVSTSTSSFLDNEFDKFYPLYKKYLPFNNVDFELVKNKRLFFAITHTLIQDARDLSLGGWHIPMERLTSDSEFFLKLVNFLTNQTLEGLQSYTFQAASISRTNYSSKCNLLSLSSYEFLPDWGQGLLVNMLNDLEKTHFLAQNYNSLGYDISLCVGENRSNFLNYECNQYEQNKHHQMHILETIISSTIKSYLKFKYDEGETIILYGSGRHTELFISEYINKYKNTSKLIVVCPSAKTNEVSGVRVIPVELFDLGSANKILISSFSYEDEIFNRLISQGVQSERIIRLYD